MPAPRVFVSSTCYDLGILRGQLRTFLLSLGFEPVMSDYTDILYDPRTHTHTSCLKEMPNCDIVLLVIGARFGGKGTPEAISQLDFEALLKTSVDISLLKKKENLSITQLEILKAVELGLPVFAFVDDRVMGDHHVYETNKASDIIDKIKFPSIEKPETAKFIFEFINFLRLRLQGNAVFPFSKHDEIESILRRQWASLFQRLLAELKQKALDERKIENMTEQFESLKAAILASIPNTDAREVARAVVRYRSLLEFLSGISDLTPLILESDIDFEALLKAGKITRTLTSQRDKRLSPRVFLIKEDGTFYETRIRYEVYEKLMRDWQDFRKLPVGTKRVAIDTSRETRGTMLIHHVDENFEEIMNPKDSVGDSVSETIRKLIELSDDKTS